MAESRNGRSVPSMEAESNRHPYSLNRAEVLALVGNKCRLCGVDTTNDMTRTMIFSGDDQERRRLMSTKIYKCLSMQVLEGDFLPKVMCSGCTYKLDFLSEFRQKAKQTEDMLLSTVYIPSEMNEPFPERKAELSKPEVDINKRPILNELTLNKKQDDEAITRDKESLVNLPLQVPLNSEQLKSAGKRRMLVGMPVFSCRFCGALFEERTLVHKHISQQHSSQRLKSSTPPLRCCVCDNSCVSREALRVHLRLHISAAPEEHHSTTPCAVCSLHNAGPRHVLLHAERPDLECSRCQQMAPSADKAAEHAFRHVDVTAPFFCSVCALNFRQRRIANDHIKTYHKDAVVQERPVEEEQAAPAPPPTPDPTPAATTAAMPLPSSRKAAPCGVKRPSTSIRSIKPRPPPSSRASPPPMAPSKQRTCPLCRRSMSWKQMGAHVLRAHADSSLCYVCLRTLPSVARLRLHLRNEHSRVNCPVCDEPQLAEGGGWLEHMRTAHAYHVCAGCPRAFPTAHAARAHYRETHDSSHGSLGVRCMWCDAHFEGVFVLSEHVDDTEACSAARYAAQR